VSYGILGAQTPRTAWINVLIFYYTYTTNFDTFHVKWHQNSNSFEVIGNVLILQIWK